MKIFALGLLMMLGLSGCSHLVAGPAPTPTATKPTMAWHWQPSTQQFKQDKYACAQDYRLTQPAIPVRRDPYTELTFMNLHMDACLESKGWESKPVVSARALPPSSALTKKNAPDAVGASSMPSNYVVPASKVLNAVSGRAYDWQWTGPLKQEPSHGQFQDYAAVCSRDYIKAQPAVFDLMPHLRVCMKGRGWDARPIVSPSEPSTAEELQKDARYEEAKKELEAFEAAHPTLMN